MKGLVYLFRHKSTSFVKIGMTNKGDVSERFACFNTYSPFGGEVLLSFSTNDARATERELHEKFKTKRMNGEFFSLDEDDITFIKNLYADERIKKCRFLFEQWIADESHNIEALKNLFRVAEERTIKGSDTELDIINFVAGKFPGQQVKNSDIVKFLAEKGILIERQTLGRLLKQFFTQKLVRVGATTTRVFLIPEGFKINNDADNENILEVG